MAAQNIRIFHPTLARAENGLMTNKLVLDSEDLQSGRVLSIRASTRFDHLADAENLRKPAPFEQSSPRRP